MRFNVRKIDKRYDFEITGMSYIGDPVNSTCLFMTGKLRKMISNLENHKNCLVFVDNTVEIPEKLASDNCFVVSENPQTEYGLFSVKMRELEQREQSRRSYKLMPEGYYLGENVVLGKNVSIEPGCLIDHDVVIGDDAFIGYGSIIRNTIIGNSFSCYERSVIGTESFNLGNTEDYSFRVPSFGEVVIGNYVDIGANVVIERGFNSNTVLYDNVKIDSGVIIGHDAVLNENTKITCGVCVAGRVTVGRDTYIGMNATIKQRVNVGEKAMVGMGASVITNVKPETTVIGNPAKRLGSE